MLAALTHQETTSGWRPRRPILCTIDLFAGTVTFLLLLSHKTKPLVAVLPLAMILQYAVSCTYHWLPENRLRQRADYLTIVLLIAATFVPFWGTLLPAPDTLLRLSLLGLLTVIICVIKWFRFTGSLYLLLGGIGPTTSFYEMQVWLPPLGLACFWLGVILYFVQFVVCISKTPNPVHGVFGYRECQHVILFCATTLHASVVLTYL